MNGLILKGGKSSRMGFDKGQIQYKNMPQVDYLYMLMSKLCNETYISVKEIDAKLDFPQIKDAYHVSSPLNGIITALSYHDSEPWLIVACDMPEIDEEILSFLLKERDSNVNFTGFMDSDNRFPEPLLGIWEPSAAIPLKQFITSEISPRKFLLSAETKLMEIPHPKYHTNINTAAEKQEYLKDRNAL